MLVRQFHLTSLDSTTSPRCAFLTSADAAALVAFWYGRLFAASRRDAPVDHGEIVLCSEGLLYALFSAGWDWSEIQAAATDYLHDVAACLSADSPWNADHEAIVLEQCLLMSFLLDLLPEAHGPILGRAQRLLDSGYETENLLDTKLTLEICLAVLGSREQPSCPPRSKLMIRSYVRPILSGNGSEAARLIDEDLNSLVLLGSTLSFRQNRIFLERTKPFWRFGQGLAVAGAREVARRCGLTLPPASHGVALFFP